MSENKSHDPTRCTMVLCDNTLDPDALEFTHKGEAAGGICGPCLGTATKLRVILQKNEEGIFFAEELQTMS